MTQDQMRDEVRDRLLLAMLDHVPFDGWTTRALETGAADLDMDGADAERWFPGGVVEVAVHFGAWADQQMQAALAASNLEGIRVRDRIALAVRLRLEALAPRREAMRAVIAWTALPSNASLGVRALYRTVDSIWYAIGDNSADFNFYTKRALLAGVVTATTLYWLGDETDGSTDSHAFLDRRIEDVLQVPKLRVRAERLAKRLPNPASLLRAVKKSCQAWR